MRPGRGGLLADDGQTPGRGSEHLVEPVQPGELVADVLAQERGVLRQPGLGIDVDHAVPDADALVEPSGRSNG